MPEPALPTATSGRLPALDGLRGIAVALVIFFHVGRYLPTDVPLDRAVHAVAFWGWSGVDLFFVLSGFLITGILHDTREAPNYFRAFYARRFLRIFPLYYLCLAVLLWLFPRLYAESAALYAERAPWHLLYLSNVLRVTELPAPELPGMSHLWSLSIEEQFYLVWPAVVLSLSRRRLLWLCGLVICSVPLLRFALLAVGVSPYALYFLTPTRMDTLAVGAWLALTVRGSGGLSAVVRPARLAFAGCGTAVVVLWAIERVTGLLAPRSIIGYSALAVFFGAALVLTLTAAPASPWGRLTRSRWLVLLGTYSYALYLVHIPVRDMLTLHGIDADFLPRLFGSALPSVIIFGALVVAVSLVIAHVSWHAFEAPILRLKQFVPYQTREMATLPDALPDAATISTASGSR